MALKDKISKSQQEGYEPLTYSWGEPDLYLKKGARLSLAETKELLEQHFFEAGGYKNNACFIENNRLEIYSNEVGAVIGKKGQNINAISNNDKNCTNAYKRKSPSPNDSV